MPDTNSHNRSMVLALLLKAAKLSIIAVSVLMVVVTLSQVVFRYVFLAPLPWSEELARYCFVWIVFLGAGVGLERGIHLGVDLLVNQFPEKLRMGLDVVSNLLIVGFAGAVVYASHPVISINAFQHSPAMGVPMSWIYMAIPVGMSLIVVVCIERIVNIVRNISAQREA